MIESKLICIIGSPHSGKSTLASDVHTTLKINGKNSIFISEVATDFIANNGIPNQPIDQVIIFYKQLEKEKLFIGSKEYIICDSSSILNYFYFRKLFSNPLSNKDIYVINHLQSEILKTIGQWFKIFYVPPFDVDENIDDGIRYQDREEIRQIDRWIKNYLEIENIPHIDLSNIDIKKRQDHVVKLITN